MIIAARSGSTGIYKYCFRISKGEKKKKIQKIENIFSYLNKKIYIVYIQKTVTKIILVAFLLSSVTFSFNILDSIHMFIPDYNLFSDLHNFGYKKSTSRLLFLFIHI